MANTVTVSTRTITIVPDGSTDFDVTSYFPRGIRLSAIDYRGVANDVLVVREASASGAIIITRKDTTGAGFHKATGGRSLRVKPYIDMTDCTFGTAASSVIIFEFD